MKKNILFLTAITFFSCTNNSEKAIELKSEADSLSYAIGLDIANNLSKQNDQIKNQIPDINIEILNSALTSNFNTNNIPVMDTSACKQIIQDYFAKQQEQQIQEQQIQSQSAIEEGENFLSENSQKEGVMTLESGLQYKVVEQGNGAMPELTDKVEVHYHGTLIDGTVFDSSVDRGETISFPVNGVIAGWTEALQLMSVGSKWKLYIPYNLAYGENGSGPIGPYATLIFDVELIAIN
jgi:FKBP-type peptidyl-prolyl cis-trans isomerase